MKPVHRAFLAVVTTCLVTCTPVLGGVLDGVEAEIRTSAVTVSPGQPIWVEFLLRNTTDSPIVLTVPGMAPEPIGSVMGLPLSHVFSGPAFSGLTVRGEHGQVWSESHGYEPPARSADIVLAAHSSVGTTVDIRDYYPALRSQGVYRLVWQPYDGALTSNQLIVDITPLKQAVIMTDFGNMTVRMRYDLAPKHVANFLELARDGFYAKTTFHRVEPGYFIQGGCPNGDGTGIRPDGKKVEAEFSDCQFKRGVVCMARVEGDPDSASSQFIIVNTRIPQWDGKYTVFGELVGEESFETLDKLMSQRPGDEWSDERPRSSGRISIRAVRVEDAPTGLTGQMLPVS